MASIILRLSILGRILPGGSGGSKGMIFSHSSSDIWYFSFSFPATTCPPMIENNGSLFARNPLQLDER
jgi:hypothetical protein